jgi:hypothetical protein
MATLQDTPARWLWQVSIPTADSRIQPQHH